MDDLTEGVIDLINNIQDSWNKAVETGNYEGAHILRMSRDELMDLYHEIEGDYPEQDFTTKFWR